MVIVLHRAIRHLLIQAVKEKPDLMDQELLEI
jgi:hypothetical protein